MARTTKLDYFTSAKRRAKPGTSERSRKRAHGTREGYPLRSPVTGTVTIEKKAPSTSGALSMKSQKPSTAGYLQIASNRKRHKAPKNR